MTVADKLLQVNQVKQDIKTALETKGIPMTNVAFTEYANKILDISGGGGITYEDYVRMLYLGLGKSNQFATAWQDMKDSESVLFDIPLMLVVPNQDMGVMAVDLYVGTDGQLQALYDACVNETLTPKDIYYVNNVATYYGGDIRGDIGFPFPIPLYGFGYFNVSDSTSFSICDLTPLSMGLGLVLVKIVSVPIPNNNIVIQQGLEFENENGIIIPDGVTSIGDWAFRDWESNNQPLVISNSVTSIGEYAFNNWNYNNQPLVIPNGVISIGGEAFGSWRANKQPLTISNSVITIGEYAFQDWTTNNQPLVIPNSVIEIEYAAFGGWYSNNQPLVIPNSVTTIGNSAFGNWTLVPYVEMKGTTPPTLASTSAFGYQNDAPIYVPDESVETYKTATNWLNLAARIFSINDK